MREKMSRPKMSVPKIWSIEPPSAQHGGCAMFSRSISSGVQGMMKSAKMATNTTTSTMISPSMPDGLFSKRRGRSNTMERSRACFFASEITFVFSAISLSPPLNSGCAGR